MRNKEDEGENQRKRKFAVEIPALKKVIGYGEPLEKNREPMELD